MTYSTPKLSETLAIASETCTSESESESEPDMINCVLTLFFLNPAVYSVFFFFFLLPACNWMMKVKKGRKGKGKGKGNGGKKRQSGRLLEES